MTEEISKYDHYNYPHTNPDAAKGHPGNTDDMQEAQVFQLRTMLEQAGYTERLDTNTLLRYLRARKFNVQASYDMFVNAEKWRKEVSLDENIKSFDFTEKEQVFQYYPQFYHKTDKDGRPVYIEKLGKIDLTALLKVTTEDRMLMHLAIEYERCADPRLPACSRVVGKLLETCCTIMDLKGVSVLNIPSAYGYLKKASVLSQDYYPERLGKLYVINAPWGFSGAFNIVKGFLDPVTVDKIHVLGYNYQKELLAQVPAENLPVEFGGTCECGGSGCMFSDAGPWHDPEFLAPAFKTKPETETAPPPPTETTTAAVPAPDTSA
ncbi:Patellin-3 [Dactylella cylindrospora]|nr:Patellin-3 [Dactylella cylindrospora]